MDVWSKDVFEKECKQLSPLPPEFYSQSTCQVAQQLLGSYLWTTLHGSLTVSAVIETEAYGPENDLASHSARGKTKRCEIMFGSPGSIYVYLIYGMYYMLNCVTEPEGFPGAVLIRALSPLWGFPEKVSLSGPGKLCRALGINQTLNGQNLFSSDIFFTSGKKPTAFSCSPRVGIRSSQDRLWRFFISHHPHVSSVPENKKSVSFFI